MPQKPPHHDPDPALPPRAASPATRSPPPQIRPGVPGIERIDLSSVPLSTVPPPVLPPPTLPPPVLPSGSTSALPSARTTAPPTRRPTGRTLAQPSVHPIGSNHRNVVVVRGTGGARPRARGTPRTPIHPGEQIRTMIFAPAAERAAWIEGELSRAPISISIQVGRRVRTVVSALVRDPPPRPHVLIVDFDALTPGEVLELHAIRDEGWPGRLIGLGTVPPALAASLEVDQVLAEPLVRDSLLDCVAGTGHAAATVPIPTEILEELAPAVRPERPTGLSRK